MTWPFVDSDRLKEISPLLSKEPGVKEYADAEEAAGSSALKVPDTSKFSPEMSNSVPG